MTQSIFAIGEAASYNNMIYGLVAPGYDMADSVARQITGDFSKQFTGFDMSTKLKLIGVDVASFGDPFGESAPSIPIAFKDHRKGTYKRINISEDGKYLLGGILIGDASSIQPPSPNGDEQDAASREPGDINCWWI